LRELVRRPPHAIVVRTDDLDGIGNEIHQSGGVKLQDSRNFNVWLLGGQYLVIVDSGFQIPSLW
jgi:hypothetical protein